MQYSFYVITYLCSTNAVIVKLSPSSKPFLLESFVWFSIALFGNLRVAVSNSNLLNSILQNVPKTCKRISDQIHVIQFIYAKILLSCW